MSNKISSKIYPFISLFLERLFWVKIISVLKYGFKPIEDIQREQQVLERIKERCFKEDYSEEIIEIFLVFFQLNMDISKYVQKEYFLKWSKLSEVEIKYVRENVNRVLQSVYHKELDSIHLVRKKIDEVDQKIFEKMSEFIKMFIMSNYEKS